MELNKEDVIVFADPLDEGYVASTRNTIKVEDLINELNLLPKIRMATRNIDSIIKADGTSAIEGGHIKISITVEHNTEDLI